MPHPGEGRRGGSPLWRALRVTARRRCPACGEGRIWKDWFTLRDRCPACGIAPARGESDYFLGAYLVNLVVAELLVALLMIVVVVGTWPSPPWDFLLYGSAVLAVVAPFVAYPFVTTFWLAIDMIFRPVGRED